MQTAPECTVRNTEKFRCRGRIVSFEVSERDRFTQRFRQQPDGLVNQSCQLAPRACLLGALAAVSNFAGLLVNESGPPARLFPCFPDCDRAQPASEATGIPDLFYPFDGLAECLGSRIFGGVKVTGYPERHAARRAPVAGEKLADCSEIAALSPFDQFVVGCVAHVMEYVRRRARIVRSTAPAMASRRSGGASFNPVSSES